MDWISDRFIKENISFKELVAALKRAFRKGDIHNPPKTMYAYKGLQKASDNMFLMMPSWDNHQFIGTKLITATPYNTTVSKPYIQGVYVLFHAETGEPLISMDAKLITSLRTAATSVLAASYLVRNDAASLLILGTGNLAPFFIRAHLSVYPYKKVLIWGRHYEKAMHIAQKMKEEDDIHVEVVQDYKSILKEVDTVSCLTSAQKPLVVAGDMGTGHHIDLVGSFTPQMHEVSTNVVSSSTVYVDNLVHTPTHAGELKKALSEKVITFEHIKGDLAYLCSDDHMKRELPEENTLFKSTGMGLEDLVTAGLIYRKYSGFH